MNRLTPLFTRFVLRTALLFMLSTAPAFAAVPDASGADTLGTFLLTIIYFIDRYAVPFIFALAFIVFLWGIYSTFIAGAANEEKRQEGQKIFIYGMIGFFIMISLWGIVNVLVHTFGFNSQTRPDYPTFGAPSSGAKSANPFDTGGATSGGTTGSGDCANDSQCAPGYTCQAEGGTSACVPVQQASDGSCHGDSDCAPGYKCAPISGESACIPR
jgi:hypothetical protein